MPRPSKRKQAKWKIAKGREKQRKARKVQEGAATEREWESSEVKEDVLALGSSQKPLVLVAHDESTFNANDGKR